MATKTQLLSALEEGLKIEETVIPIYSRHLTNTLFLSGLPNDRQEKVTQILDILREDSMRHKTMFEGLINRVKESPKNVY